MEKIILGRGEGKTKKLIEISAKTGNYIVCASMDEAARIQNVAVRMNLKIPLPITYSDFLGNGYYARGINGFLIDNIEALIQFISPRVSVNAITMLPNNPK